jgi:hypothetical protein
VSLIIVLSVGIVLLIIRVIFVGVVRIVVVGFGVMRVVFDIGKGNGENRE